MTFVLGRWPRRAAFGARPSGVLRAFAVATVPLLVATGCSFHSKHSAQWPDEPRTGKCAVTKQVDVPATHARRRRAARRRLPAEDLRRGAGDPDADAVRKDRTRKSSRRGTRRRTGSHRTAIWSSSRTSAVRAPRAAHSASSPTIRTTATTPSNGPRRCPAPTARSACTGRRMSAPPSGSPRSTAPPHLVTIVPANTASDYYDGWTYEGGEFRLGVRPAVGDRPRHDRRREPRRHTARSHALKAAAAEPDPLAGLPAVQGPSADAARQPRRSRRGTSTGSGTRPATTSGSSSASATATPK